MSPSSLLGWGGETLVPSTLSLGLFSPSITCYLHAANRAHDLHWEIILLQAFKSEGWKGNLAAKKDKTQTHRTPEDKGKGGSRFHFSIPVTLLAGQGNQALPKLVYQPAFSSPTGTDAPSPTQVGQCPRGRCWLLSWVHGSLLLPPDFLQNNSEVITERYNKLPNMLHLHRTHLISAGRKPYSQQAL